MFNYSALLLAISALLVAPQTAKQADRLVAPSGGFIQFEHHAIAYLPEQIETKAPVLIVLHGNGGSPGSSLPPLLEAASERNLVLLAVKSRRDTWDALDRGASQTGGFNNRQRRLPKWDRRNIERMLELLANEIAIDRSRIGIYGFSDGASMALSLGIADPERYRFVGAFSPGGVIPGRTKPASAGQRIFITHATDDRILAYTYARGTICRYMNRGDRSVMFKTFEGGHIVDRSLIAAAMNDFLYPATRPAKDSEEYGCEG